MQEKDLHKLGKTELLSIIYNQQKEINSLNEEIKILNNKLEDRTININEAGSIAEASLRLNDIFNKAQAAADEYLENIKKINDNKLIQVEKNTTKENKKRSTNVDTETDNIIDNSKKCKIGSAVSKPIIFTVKNQEKSVNDLNSKSNVINVINEKCQNLKNKASCKLQDNSKSNIVLSLVPVKEKSLKRKRITWKEFKENIYRFFKFIKVKFLERMNIILEKAKKVLDFYKAKKCKIKFFKKNKIEKESENIEINLNNLEKEIDSRKSKENKVKFVKTITYFGIIIVAITIIAATRVFNVLQVSGNSMEPSLYSGELLISTKIFGYKKGDIIAFYYNDNVLIKRIVATGGDVINIDDQGFVYVNSEKLEEKYVKELDYGRCDIKFPYRVPDKEVFVLGDNRKISIDSRNKSIGSISEDKILGKIEVKLNPFVIY